MRVPTAPVLLVCCLARPAIAGDDVAPRPEVTPPPEVRFVADPISDGALLSLSLGMAALSEVIIGTGEIRPQQPQPSSELLAIDRGVIEADPIPTWGTISNIGAGTAIAFAAIDPVLSGTRYGAESGIVDAVLYAESISLTWALTNLSKIAVRRPRPSAYQEQERLNQQYPDPETRPDISQTNSALSFFSGHASITSAVATTATYLAFARDPRSARPWVTLGIGGTVTALVAIGRVKNGHHFPTDVIAGTMVGFGIGVLVPHLHREARAAQRHTWIGLAPIPGGAAVALNGVTP